MVLYIYIVDNNIKNDKENFRALLTFRINAGDQILKEQLQQKILLILVIRCKMI